MKPADTWRRMQGPGKDKWKLFKTQMKQNRKFTQQAVNVYRCGRDLLRTKSCLIESMENTTVFYNYLQDGAY